MERSIDEKPRVRPLPDVVVQARLAAAADDAANEKVAGPRITAMLTACKLAAHDLEATHSAYASDTDLDLAGYSRTSAMWLLSGRVLGLLRAFLVQIEGQAACGSR